MSCASGATVYIIYTLSECVEIHGSQQITKACPHIAFGVIQRRCDTKLLKTVELASGKKDVLPAEDVLLHRSSNIPTKSFNLFQFLKEV